MSCNKRSGQNAVSAAEKLPKHILRIRCTHLQVDLRHTNRQQLLIFKGHAVLGNVLEQEYRATVHSLSTLPTDYSVWTGQIRASYQADTRDATVHCMCCQTPSRRLRTIFHTTMVLPKDSSSSYLPSGSLVTGTPQSTDQSQICSEQMQAQCPTTPTCCGDCCLAAAAHDSYDQPSAFQILQSRKYLQTSSEKHLCTEHLTGRSMQSG